MKKGLSFWLIVIFLSAIVGILLGIYEVAYGKYQANLLIGIGLIGYLFYIISKRNNDNVQKLQKQINALKKGKKK